MLIPDESIPDNDRVNEILDQGKYATIALSDGNDSYILTLFYGFDPEIETLYFISTRSGIKFDFLKSNPYVCGTVILQPDQSDSPFYRSVIFRGLVEVIHSPIEKEKALTLINMRLPLSGRTALTEDHTDIDSKILIMKLQIDDITAREYPQ